MVNRYQRGHALLVMLFVAFFVTLLFLELHDLRARVSALESRAAWYMPEGQEHKPGVKRDE